MLSRTRISTRLVAGFSLILVATLLLGLMSLRSIDRLAGASQDMVQHPFTVSIAIRESMTEVLVAQQVMNTLVHYTGAEDVERFRTKLDAQRESNNAKLALIRERYAGSPVDIDRIEQALSDWREARTTTIALLKNGRRAEAVALYGTEGDKLVETVLERMEAVSKFAGERVRTVGEAAAAEAASAVQLTGVALLLILVGGTALTFFVTDSVRRSLRNAADEVKRVIESSTEKARVVEAIGGGDLSQEMAVSAPLKVDLEHLPDDETGVLLRAAAQLSVVQSDLDASFRNMTSFLRQARQASRNADWVKSGLNELNSLMRGEQAAPELGDKALTYLVEYLSAGVGALYLLDERAEELQLTATYAFTRRKNLGDRFRLGEGLIGQAARERKAICLANVPPDYLPIGSALGESVPKVVLALPLLHGTRLIGALEIGAFADFTDLQLEFLGLAQEALAIGLSVTQSRERMAELLEETQQQAEELRVQQEELQQSNEELEERAQMLEQQRENIRAKNREIEIAAEDLRRKAEELERVSTYKSEFLANMSHELRTPLNSLMILSSLLMQNKDENLTAKQIEFASTIHAAGADLLNLINDILDLAKIEAGRIEFDHSEIRVDALFDSIRTLFQPQADQKGLDFTIETGPAAPREFNADSQRVHQILKNLISNALKFTEHGEVRLRVGAPSARENPLGVPAVAFVVSDTGIGISQDKQQSIFEAFKQADGSISRKYGGTGLGLSISLELARKMGGDIRMTSTQGRGSVFTLYLPLSAVVRGAAPVRSTLPAQAVATPPPAPPRSPLPVSSPLLEELTQTKSADRSILVIEDDPDFAKILQEMIRERDFHVLVAENGEKGLELAERELPSAIILDVMLPGIDGWNVMRSLKDNPRTRHIPVHFLTCLEERQKAMEMAAIGFVTKPVDTGQLNEIFEAIERSIEKSVKKLLVVEDDQDEAYSLVALLDDKDVEITVAASGGEAIDRLSAETFDCIVLDLGLPGMSGFDLLDHIQSAERHARVPIIIHSGRELSEDDERRLRRYAESIVIKGAKSPERLLNEVTLFLHQVETELPAKKQRMIRAALDKEAMLEGRKVLLVDDDMRNLFSLSSVLGEKNMVVIEAENGRKALDRLEEHPDVSIVLMDIMMPETDGYTAMREIRKNPRFANLPVIAMTAKAMKGDYEKCIDAGASDYIAKPIDIDKLFSLIRVWMYQRA
ncbi:MAG: response regulator [Aromatoleum sp.]|jgi:CheY-like chemotaxis protein|uniref:response regulator n=1 Tax=Aromatoleum sp. TaxID=2307007 RepID=UPI0028944D36|nr:response regulator [Aromatoleum sp.]MDT3672390.1 response regulator [Aromatoleum sp.]